MSQLTQVWREFFQDSSEVNIVQLDDLTFWFQASHLCKSLGYKNTQVALQTHCEDYEIKKLDVGQHYDVNFVSESGFYSLILGSKKPKAKEFKKWICTDILPKLRASGGYIMPNVTSEQLVGLQEEIVQLQKRNKQFLMAANKRVRLGINYKNDYRLKITQALKIVDQLFFEHGVNGLYSKTRVDQIKAMYSDLADRATTRERLFTFDHDQEYIPQNKYSFKTRHQQIIRKENVENLLFVCCIGYRVKGLGGSGEKQKLMDIFFPEMNYKLPGQ